MVEITWKSTSEFREVYIERERSQSKRASGTLEHRFALDAAILDSCPREKTITYGYRVLPEMANAWGGCHGGAIATILDHAMAAMIRNQFDHDLTPTVSLQLNYLYTVSMDKTLYVRTKLCRKGKNIAFTTAEAWNDDDNCPCVTAQATYALK